LLASGPLGDSGHGRKNCRSAEETSSVIAVFFSVEHWTLAGQTEVDFLSKNAIVTLSGA
jgi:hypothetical protein